MPDWSHLGVLIPSLAGLVMCLVVAVLAVTAAWTRHAGRRDGALCALALLLRRTPAARRPPGAGKGTGSRRRRR